VPKLHIVCLRPAGMNRGGTRHEGHKVHELDAFTAAQLRDMHDEPDLALIVGGETLTEEQMVAAEEKAAAVKAAAERVTAAKAEKAKG
jgi:hypothetical protein